MAAQQSSTQKYTKAAMCKPSTACRSVCSALRSRSMARSCSWNCWRSFCHWPASRAFSVSSCATRACCCCKRTSPFLATSKRLLSKRGGQRNCTGSFTSRVHAGHLRGGRHSSVALSAHPLHNTYENTRPATMQVFCHPARHWWRRRQSVTPRHERPHRARNAPAHKTCTLPVCDSAMHINTWHKQRVGTRTARRNDTLSSVQHRLQALRAAETGGSEKLALALSRNSTNTFDNCTRHCIHDAEPATCGHDRKADRGVHTDRVMWRKHSALASGRMRACRATSRAHTCVCRTIRSTPSSAAPRGCRHQRRLRCRSGPSASAGR